MSSGNLLKVRRGFTIVELLVVIVVMAILATISVVVYTGIQDRARVTNQVMALSQLSRSFALYVIEHGEYPYSGAGAFQVACLHPQPLYDSCEEGAIATSGSTLRINMAVTEDMNSKLAPYFSAGKLLSSYTTLNNGVAPGADPVYNGIFIYTLFYGDIPCPAVGGLSYLSRTYTAEHPFNTSVKNMTGCRYKPDATLE